MLGSVTPVADRRMRFLVPLVVVALLVCHGALGALHVVSSAYGSEISGNGHVAHQTTTPTTPGADVTSESHTAAVADYAAVLFVLIFGTTLWSLMRNRWVRPVAATAVWSPAPLNRRSGPCGPALIRGPDAPRLQVFRL